MTRALRSNRWEAFQACGPPASDQRSRSAPPSCCEGWKTSRARGTRDSCAWWPSPRPASRLSFSRANVAGRSFRSGAARRVSATTPCSCSPGRERRSGRWRRRRSACTVTGLVQRARCTSPVTVQALLRRRHLPERLSRPGDQERGVVAETRLAPPLRNDPPSTFALEKLSRLAGRGEGHHAHESRVPRARLVFQPSQQLGGALLLRWSEAGGPQAWKASQRFDLNARVIS